MIRVYVAAPFVCKAEAKLVRSELQSHGFDVTSRWIDNHHATEVQADDLMNLEANVDLEDICASDALVLVHYPDIAKLGSGGKHFETGYAVALGIPVFVLGKPTSVFHYLKDEVSCFMDIGQLIVELKKVSSRVEAAEAWLKSMMGVVQEATGDATV